MSAGKGKRPIRSGATRMLTVHLDHCRRLRSVRVARIARYQALRVGVLSRLPIYSPSGFTPQTGVEFISVTTSAQFDAPRMRP